MSKEHIMHSDVVVNMKYDNYRVAKGIVNEVCDLVAPIQKRCASATKGDECLIVYAYVRKGNDILVNGCDGQLIGTSATKMDYLMAIDGFEIDFYSKGLTKH